MVSSRAFTTNFHINVISSLITATGMHTQLFYDNKCLKSFVVADFDLPSSNVLFNSSIGQETVITVYITDDIIYEPRDSSFTLTLVVPETAKPLGVTIGEYDVTTISIIDNDS